MSPYQGLIAAPYTAFNADYSLNLDVIARQAARLREDGVIGAFVCGTTGEGVSMTLPERMAVTERWVKEARGLRIIVNVSHACLADAQALAAHAAGVGAQAFATLAPSFFKPPNVEAMVDYCVELTQAAPQLPFYFYHIPALTGVQMSMSAFMQGAMARIPTFAGLKFTDYDLLEYRRCLTLAGDTYHIYFGRDEMLLGALATGAQGAVGSTYNYMAPLYLQMIAAWQAGDQAMAQALQARIVEVIAIMSRFGGMPAGKVMMRQIGIDCGPVRLPLQTLREDQAQGLYQALAAHLAGREA